MNTWCDFMCESTLFIIMFVLAMMAIITFIGFIVDRLRERKEIRRILLEKYSEEYIRYRIDRWNRKGY